MIAIRYNHIYILGISLKIIFISYFTIPYDNSL